MDKKRFITLGPALQLAEAQFEGLSPASSGVYWPQMLIGDGQCCSNKNPIVFLGGGGGVGGWEGGSNMYLAPEKASLNLTHRDTFLHYKIYWVCLITTKIVLFLMIET
jgi:hypothetical protein